MRLVVNGCAGRMGRTLLKLINDHADCELAGGLESAGAPEIGTDLGSLIGEAALGISVTDDALAMLKDADGVIDFSAPAASVELAGLAAQSRIVHVIGTTGFDATQEAAITAAARHATIIKSGNMSLGVNLLAGLVRQAAKALDPSWDIEILDMHHRHKVDAPSGTALMLGDAAAAGRGVTLEDVAARGRDGITGERAAGAIGIAALRGGSVVGDHQVIFAGDGERLTLGHIAEDRAIFARGALRAALWGADNPPGLYHMADILGLSQE